MEMAAALGHLAAKKNSDTIIFFLNFFWIMITTTKVYQYFLFDFPLSISQN